MEPLDKELGAEISRRSPQSADPDSYNTQPLTPPPFWIKTTRNAFDICSKGGQSHITIAQAKKS